MAQRCGNALLGKLIFKLLRTQEQVVDIEICHRLVFQSLDLSEL
jgi:hypothetical protein